MSHLAFFVFVQKAIGIFTAVLYGMIAVWAVRSRWHWFVRAAIVGATLAALLSLPYFEWTIQFGAAVIVFVAGFVFWWGLQGTTKDSQNQPATERHWPRFTLRDVFLVTIVAAAILAVFVSAPKRRLFEWLFTIIDGAIIASVGLACAWLALGRARLAYRVVAAPIVFAYGVAVADPWMIWLGPGFVRFLAFGTHTFDIFWADLWRRFFRYGSSGLPDWIFPIAAGIAAFTVWLNLASASQRLSQAPAALVGKQLTDRGPLRRRVNLQWAFAMLTIAIAALPVYTWLRLITPLPLPPEAFTSNEGYRELAAAADELLKLYGTNPFPSLRGSDAQFAALVARDEPQWRRVRAAIEKGCQFPWQIPPEKPDITPIQLLSALMRVRIDRGDGTGAIEPKIAACLDYIRLAQMQSRASSLYGGYFTLYEHEAEGALWNMRPNLSSQQCQEIAQALWQIDQKRESWEEFAKRSRRIRQNAGWYSHYELVVSDLAGWNGPYPPDRMLALQLRMLIVELGIRAHELEVGRLPTTLAELTPEFLEMLPDDPFGQGPLIYKLTGDSYLLYSVGANGIDDDGVNTTVPSHSWLGDLTTSRMFQVPRRPPPPASPQPAAGGEKKKDAAAADENDV